MSETGSQNSPQLDRLLDSLEGKNFQLLDFDPSVEDESLHKINNIGSAIVFLAKDIYQLNEDECRELSNAVCAKANALLEEHGLRPIEDDREEDTISHERAHAAMYLEKVRENGVELDAPSGLIMLYLSRYELEGSTIHGFEGHYLYGAGVETLTDDQRIDIFLAPRYPSFTDYEKVEDVLLGVGLNAHTAYTWHDAHTAVRVTREARDYILAKMQQVLQKPAAPARDKLLRRIRRGAHLLKRMEVELLERV